jgi:hypothetical protein
MENSETRMKKGKSQTEVCDVFKKNESVSPPNTFQCVRILSVGKKELMRINVLKKFFFNALKGY